uniref:Prefoldin subunit alpha n=1 Tax=Ignisphaera aggregans TaxID=334771 RepID=A0A7C2VFS4_9CREN
MTAVSRTEAEKAVQQLFAQLEELKAAIQALQNRSLEISAEIQEIKLAYETISTIQQLGQVETMSSLDRRGYAYVRTRLESTDKALIRIGHDLYALVPIDTAKNVLVNIEKDVTEELRRVEAELKQLTGLYTQIQKKLQEYVAILSREGEQQ